MYISVRVDYALRAMLAVAASHPIPLAANRIAAAEGIPLRTLQGILADLRRRCLLQSHRGVDAGYSLSRPANRITVGDVLRAADGALTTVAGVRALPGSSGVQAVRGLDAVWRSLDRAMAEVVDRATLADLLARDISV